MWKETNIYEKKPVQREQLPRYCCSDWTLDWKCRQRYPKRLYVCKETCTKRATTALLYLALTPRLKMSTNIPRELYTCRKKPVQRDILTHCETSGTFWHVSTGQKCQKRPIYNDKRSADVTNETRIHEKRLKFMKRDKSIWKETYTKRPTKKHKRLRQRGISHTLSRLHTHIRHWCQKR